jgi:hypothetical protein
LTDTPETTAPRSRRALLVGAAGAAAAAAATMVVPAVTLAHDVDDLQLGVDNATTAATSITQGTADTNAFEATGNGAGVGVLGRTPTARNAAVVALSGDDSQSDYADPARAFDLDSGLYAYADNGTGYSTGVWAEGANGVYAFADWGVYADGFSLGVFGGAYSNGTGVHAHTGNSLPPNPASNVALRGTVSNSSQAGIQAYGKVQFPNRSGRATFASGQSSKSVTISGVSSTNYAFAVLNASRTGVYVRAVVPAANKITIYLSKAVTSSTPVAWVVLG